MRERKPTARTVLLSAEFRALDREAADALERRFFNQLVLSNGTLKTTFSDRLTDVDTMCIRHLSGIDKTVTLLDVGVSSGVTTHEWSETMEKAGFNYSIDAFDLCVDASILSAGEHFHILRDSSTRPLQFELFGRAIENTLGETLSRKARRFLPILALRCGHFFVSKIKGLRAQDVQLVTRHLRQDGPVNVFEYDLQDVDLLDRNYTMIRAANILNLAYFDRSFIQSCIQKLSGKLEEDGYLCVVRTHADGINHGSLFQKTAGRFHTVGRVGEGSEIEDIVVG
jgi:hypothetical protein